MCREAEIALAWVPGAANDPKRSVADSFTLMPKLT
jgi:hypothetical protein